MAHLSGSGIQAERSLRAESAILCLKELELGLLAVIDADYTLRFIDFTNYRLFGGGSLSFTSEEPLSVDIAAKGHLCIAAEPEGTQAQVYSVKKQKLLCRVGAHQGAVTCVAFDPQDRYAVTAGDDGKVTAWELKSCKRAFNIPAHTDRVSAVAFSCDGALVATGGYDRTVQLSKSGTGHHPQMLRSHRTAVTALRFVEGVGLLSADREGQIVVWDVEAAGVLKRLPRADGAVRALCCDDEARLLFVATEQGSVALYDLEKLEAVDTEYLKFPHPVSAMAYCSQHRRLAVGTADGGIHIFNIYGDAALCDEALRNRDYDTLDTLARSNAALRFSPAYRTIAAEWDDLEERVDGLIAKDRPEEAYLLIGPYLGVRSRQKEVETLEARLKAYERFREHVRGGRFNIAYDLALKFPFFKETLLYGGMESQWQRAYRAAAKRLLDRRTEEEGMALLSPYRGISEKTAAIRELVEESRRARYFGELVGRREWKKACDIVRHHPQLQRTDAYQSLLNVADKLFISAQKAYSAEDFKTARDACDTLLDFPDYKEDAMELLARMKG